ncbi:non-ribosomal peptide synthetase [Bacillus atrophaeus]|uniref:non-ribosomal peptide synthetase n=1 Tax=Bacillus atrophaeus TaxID=1452 RepID=UPI002E1AA29D|nr:non-ribosomal peptide synthetase [Bacillus atrophaeus]MED4721878.1 amino acid adenylation domain-containing protein [Bacillus atrophaeus]
MQIKDLSSIHEYKVTESFWKEQLSSGVPDYSLFNSGYQMNKDNPCGHVEVIMDAELSQRLQKVSKSQDLFLFSWLQAALRVCLVHYTDQERITIGVPVIGKDHEQRENLNDLLPIGTEIDPHHSFKQVVEQVQQTTLLGYENQRYPLSELLAKLYATPFQIVLGMEGLHNKSSIEECLENELAIWIRRKWNEKHNEFEFQFSCKSHSLFPLQQFAQSYLYVLTQVLRNPDLAVKDICIISEEEKELLEGFNQVQMGIDLSQTFQDLFEEQVLKTPDQIAVICNDQSLTYRELNKKANQLASVLQSKGVSKESIIGVMVDRSLEVIIGMMGILKAGGVYLPIDPHYPIERIEYMLQDSQAKWLLSKRTEKELPQFAGEVLYLDEEHLFQGEESNLDRESEPNDLAYIIYTSGSTGNPKGVMVEQRSLVHFLSIMREKLKDNQSFLFLASVSFDISLLEICIPLTQGSKVVIATEGQFATKELAHLVKEHKVDLWESTPSRMELILSDPEGAEFLRDLKAILLAGEAFSIDLIEKIRSISEAQILNIYGPTETTLCAALKDLSTAKEVTIGKPNPNYRSYVLNKYSQMKPWGMPGELCVAGVAVARGYLGKSKLTDEKFVPNPFVAGETMYRTGDLVRWLPNGELEYLGRMDHQVKIRGYRIELGEIEAQLKRHPEISRAVVVDQVDGNRKLLAAYYVSDKKIPFEELRKYLNNKLPEFMIPEKMIQVKEIPLNPNGKVDRKRLLDLTQSDQISIPYAAPRNQIEQKLVQAWEKVMEIERIGIHDNFFALGGESIKALQIINLLGKDHLKVSTRDIFKHLTIAQLSSCVEVEQKEESLDKIPTRVKDLSKPFSLTEVQTAYMLGRNPQFELSGISPQTYSEYETKLDINRLSQSFQKVIQRHPMLRAVILPEGKQQILQDVPDYQIEIEDLTGLDDGKQNVRLQEERSRMTNHVFPLGQWPLFELKAFLLKEDTYLLCFRYDALLMDGASMNIVGHDLLHYYHKPDQRLEPLSFDFQDYMFIYDEMEQSKEYKKAKDYWTSKLPDFPFAPSLLLKKDPAEIATPTFQSLTKILDKDKWTKLRKLAQEKEVTPSALLCTIYGEVLAYWSNQRRLAINLTVFNRYPVHEEVEQIVGDFTSLILLDMDMNPEQSFFTRVEQTQSTLLDGLEHRHYDGVHFIRDFTRYHQMRPKAVMPIVFTSMLAGAGAFAWEQLGSLRRIHARTPQVYLDNVVIEKNGELLISWNYVEELFDVDVMEAMFSQFVDLLEQLVKQRDVTFLQVKKSDQTLIEQYNQTTEKIPSATLYQLFADQVQRTPDQVAVVFEQEWLTYLDLHQRSNQVAHYLQEQGIGLGDRVGLLAQRRVDTIVNMMGILKAGAAYVPIDPDHPRDRQTYILENSSCKLLLESGLYEEKHLSSYAAEDLPAIAGPEDLAYIIYTSGSTGKPKGVIITHQAVANTIQDINQKYQVNEDDRIIGISSMCFDLSVYDIFGTLSTGAMLVMIRDPRDMQELIRTVERRGITIWNTVPAIMDLALDQVGSHFENSSLRLVLHSGDWIPLPLPEKIKRHFPIAEVISLGGATEASIWSIYYPVKQVEAHWNSIPYGMPLANQTYYVLNYDKKMCPVGVIGDLYIGGVGLAQGYANDEQKTNEVFVSHSDLGLIYKTGDCGRMHPEGYIEFLGRQDYQVKIQGYRVELKEIAHCLLTYKQVDQAVVIDQTDENGMKFLVAYVVTEQDISTTELRKHLRDHLPEYMIPSYFVYLERLPLTPNGKLDRKALPAPEKQTNEVYIAPKTEMEKVLTSVWQEVLKADQIGVNDHFFALGGDSIKAIQVSVRLYAQGFQLDPKSLFDFPVLGDMVHSVKRLDHPSHSQTDDINKKKENKVTSLNVSDEPLNQHTLNKIQEKMPDIKIERIYPLAPFQQVIYEHAVAEPDTNAYFEQTIWTLEGKLDVDLFIQCFQQLVDRHDSLRTIIVQDEQEQPWQAVLHDVQMISEVQSLIEMTRQEQQKYLNQWMSENSGRGFYHDELMTRLCVFQLGNDEHKVVWSAHHLLCDGWSVSILVDELFQLYEAKNAGTTVELPPAKPFQAFIDWTLAQDHEKARHFWRDYLSGYNRKISIPKKKVPTQSKELSFTFMDLSLDEDLTNQLRTFVTKHHVTMNSALLAVWGILLGKYNGTKEVVLPNLVSVRPPKVEGIENMFGLFTNVLPIRVAWAETQSFVDLLQKVQQETLKCNEYAYFSFVEIQKQSELNDQLTDHLWVFENYPANPAIFSSNENRNFAITDYQVVDEPHVKYGIICFPEEKLTMKFGYNQNIYEAEQIQEILNHLHTLIKTIVHHPTQTIDDYQL